MIITILAILLAFIGSAAGLAGSDLAAVMNYYAHEFLGSLAGISYFSLLFVCLIAIALVIWSLGGGFLAVLFPSRKYSSETPRRLFIAAIERSRAVLLVVPAVLIVTLAGLVMGEVNEFSRSRLMDGTVIGWERALFGTYVFAALGNVHYPYWLIEFIIFSFSNMSLLIILSGVVLAYIAVDRFRELVLAFSIGIFLMIPLWLMLPVLSPQDRYINNVYHLPVPAPIAETLAHYHPQPELANFFQSVRADKTTLPAMPTSTTPSAHVFWATIAGYYLFRSRKWLGWIALPFLLASSFGTILLAQHYFVDVPGGIIVAAIAIWLADDIDAMSTSGSGAGARGRRHALP